MRCVAILALTLTAAVSCSEPPLAPVAGSPATAIAAPSGQALSLAGLAPGDRIVVEYSSSGCWSRLSLQLVFVGHASGVTLFGEGVSTNWEKPFPAITPRLLPQADLVALDKLLMLYRNSGERQCAWDDTVHLKAFRNGVLVNEERYVDSSCAWFHDPDVLTFGQVALAAGN